VLPTVKPPYLADGLSKMLERRSSNLEVARLPRNPWVTLWAHMWKRFKPVGRNRASGPALSTFKDNGLYVAQADEYLAFGWHLSEHCALARHPLSRFKFVRLP
jgi:hypothetical protein